MSTWKRFLTLFLAAMMILPVFSGCKKDKESGKASAKTIGNNLYMTNTANSATGTKLSDCGAVFSGKGIVEGIVEKDNNAFAIFRPGTHRKRSAETARPHHR